jgi:four helix bundle protein
MFNFEKLAVWTKAIEFADLVYSMTRRFPQDERFGLTNQMRRAAVSVASNISEGSSRGSRVHFAQDVEVAAGSLFEVVTQATIAKRQNFLTDDQYTAIYSAADEQSRMLSGLQKSLRSGGSKP